ncbi:MAG: ABC transporter ATP-binding protein [Burkholderiaceae bacterium]|jgi:simple sugar transport system ATP-binding protein
MAAPANPRLNLRGITKRYPAVLANDAVDLTVQPGEIHALLGENGAGKSTLMKIIYGAVQPDAGTIEFNGQAVLVRGPQQARALGISMVFQHFSLFDTLSVAENVWLGLDRSIALSEVARRITAKASAYGLEIDPQRPVHTLSVGEMQRVEIIRALLSDPQLLILDEPTSVLTPSAVERLFQVLRQLASQGCSIVYISHKLHEIRALCSACTVLRGGRVTGRCDPRQESDASLSRMMIGSDPPQLQHRQQAPGAVALAVKGLSVARGDPFGTDLQDVSLELRAGEILGVAGVSGNGQRELLACLSGEDRRAPRGSITLLGQEVSQADAGRRRVLGQHFVPEERLGRGAVPSLSLALNTLLSRREPIQAGWWIDRTRMRALASHLISRFNVRAGGPDSLAQSLSGGNLQKFIVGREIDAQPRVLIVSQPTWGVDVGASAQIRASLLALRDQGTAVLVISEELDELFELADRLVVMAKGRLSPAMPRQGATTERIGRWMSGLWQEERPA